MKKQIILTCYALLSLVYAQSQSTVTTSGGSASGSDGSGSYTIGQVSYQTNNGSNASIGEGVQQPYDISTTTGIEIKNINLLVSAYPNPTNDFLTLEVKEIEIVNLSLELYDTQGKLILNKLITTNQTHVAMTNLPTGTYCIKISQHNKLLKTFNVLKR